MRNAVCQPPHVAKKLILNKTITLSNLHQISCDSPLEAQMLIKAKLGHLLSQPAHLAFKIAKLAQPLSDGITATCVMVV